jgi:hypothetical protein
MRSKASPVPGNYHVNGLAWIRLFAIYSALPLPLIEVCAWVQCPSRLPLSLIRQFFRIHYQVDWYISVTDDGPVKTDLVITSLVVTSISTFWLRDSHARRCVVSPRSLTFASMVYCSSHCTFTLLYLNSPCVYINLALELCYYSIEFKHQR